VDNAGLPAGIVGKIEKRILASLCEHWRLKVKRFYMAAALRSKARSQRTHFKIMSEYGIRSRSWRMLDSILGNTFAASSR
jgi:hypothetical protein